MAPNITFCASQRFAVGLGDVHCVEDLIQCVIRDVVPSPMFLSTMTMDAVKSSFYVLCNGRKLPFASIVEDNKTYHIVPRLLGGKGGFGSMLRAIGAQIEKTTSREACRDLSGRRMRDINNEKKLKEWLAKETERENERESRRQERLAKRLAPHRHKFDDKEYQEQKIKVQEDLEEALSTGLKRKQNESTGGPSSSKKSKETGCSSSKAEWLGGDLDSDDLDSSSDTEANPGCLEDSLTQKDMKSQTDSSSSRDSGEESISCSLEANTITGSADKLTSAVTDICERLTNTDSTGNISSDNPISEHSDGSVEVTSKCSQKPQSPVNVPAQIADDEPVDLDLYGSVEELSKLGLERLKNALMARGLKCGGTLQERSARLFSVKGLSPDQIEPTLFANSKGKGKGKKSK